MTVPRRWFWCGLCCLFWCQSFGDVSTYYTFSSVWVAEWPPFWKLLPARLAICSHCLFSVVFIPRFDLRIGFGFLSRHKPTPSNHNKNVLIRLRKHPKVGLHLRYSNQAPAALTRRCNGHIIWKSVVFIHTCYETKINNSNKLLTQKKTYMYNLRWYITRVNWLPTWCFFLSTLATAMLRPWLSCWLYSQAWVTRCQLS